MKQCLLSFFVLAMMLPGMAAAQLHGTHETVERPREPGVRPNTLEAIFVGAMEESHNIDAWKEHGAASFTMKLQLGEDDPLEVKAVFATKDRAFALAVNGNPVLGHDGRNAWHTPAAKSLDDAAVHVRMLAQLPAMPYRMRDDTRIVIGGPMRMINDRRYYAATLEHVEGDDWSVLLVQPHTDLLHIVAYFIRTSEEDDPAFSPAYAMVSADYEKADDIPFAPTWNIWRWSRPRGLVGDEPIGKVTVSDVSFIETCADTFAKPAADDDA